MNWQLLGVVLIVGIACSYLGRQTWRTWSGKKAGCGGGCNCSEKKIIPFAQANGDGAVLIPSEQITLRLREPGHP